MADEREPLPPGQLPNITDTNPPPLHPTTVVGDGVVYVDKAKATPAPAAASPGVAPAAHPAPTKAAHG
jgi:hypothetical protein